MSATYLAFDFGTRAIGVAVGQSVTGTATALTTLRARDGVPDWQQVAALIHDWQPRQLIVGLPLNMDDSESELSARARKFANRLHGRFGVAVALMDERLSTREAKDLAREQGHRGNYRDDPVDALSAALILESWLSQRGD